MQREQRFLEGLVRRVGGIVQQLKLDEEQQLRRLGGRLHEQVAERPVVDTPTADARAAEEDAGDAAIEAAPGTPPLDLLLSLDPLLDSQAVSEGRAPSQASDVVASAPLQCPPSRSYASGSSSRSEGDAPSLVQDPQFFEAVGSLEVRAEGWAADSEESVFCDGQDSASEPSQKRMRHSPSRTVPMEQTVEPEVSASPTSPATVAHDEPLIVSLAPEEQRASSDVGICAGIPRSFAPGGVVQSCQPQGSPTSV